MSLKTGSCRHLTSMGFRPGYSSKPSVEVHTGEHKLDGLSHVHCIQSPLSDTDGRERDKKREREIERERQGT